MKEQLSSSHIFDRWIKLAETEELPEETIQELKSKRNDVDAFFQIIRNLQQKNLLTINPNPYNPNPQSEKAKSNLEPRGIRTSDPELLRALEKLRNLK